MSKYRAPNLPAVFTAGAGDQLRDFDKQLLSELSSESHSIEAILDKGISLADNIDADVVSFTSSATPDAENIVPHNLRKVPQHFLVSSIDKGGVVYKSATPATNTHIYLKSTAASAAVKIILL